MPIEWDTLVLEARRKAREVNPRACILTDVDVVLAMAAEIDRLRAANAELVRAGKELVRFARRFSPHAHLTHEVQAMESAFAAAEASDAPP